MEDKSPPDGNGREEEGEDATQHKVPSPAEEVKKKIPKTKASTKPLPPIPPSHNSSSTPTKPIPIPLLDSTAEVTSSSVSLSPISTVSASSSPPLSFLKSTSSSPPVQFSPPPAVGIGTGSASQTGSSTGSGTELGSSCPASHASKPLPIPT